MTPHPIPPASALLACPLCPDGGEPYAENTATEACVGCRSCGLSLTRTHRIVPDGEGARYDTEGMGRAIADWNTRATPSDARRARAVERAAQRIADKYCAPKYSDGDWAVPAIAAIISAELGAGEGRDGWIACSERMPTKADGFVLGWAPGHAVGAVWISDLPPDCPACKNCPRGPHLHGALHAIHGLSHTSNATHWQHYPAPPITTTGERK